MPHLVITYTQNLSTDIQALCSALAHAICSMRDTHGEPVFPTAGTRVMALRADHFAVADGAANKAFAYLQLRIAPGRPASTVQLLGDTLHAIAKAHFAQELSQRAIGLTLQIDEGAPVFDAKFGNLHAATGPT